MADPGHSAVCLLNTTGFELSWILIALLSFSFPPFLTLLLHRTSLLICLSVCLSSPASVLMRDKQSPYLFYLGIFLFCFICCLGFLFDFDIDHDLELDTDS